MDFFDFVQNHAAVFLLMLTRLSGVFIASPFFGSMNIPKYIRVGTAFFMAVVFFPVVDNLPQLRLPTTVFGYAGVVLVELFIGWLIGFVAYITLSAINMAGKIMDLQVGFSMVSVMDPTSGQQNALIGSFLYNLGIIVFLVTNGHHVLLSAMVESFRAIPIMGMETNLAITDLMVNFTNGIFSTGVKIAMPVTFAILLTNVSLGILARTMPQLNIFVVGVPLQIIIGIFILALMLPFYILFLDVLFNEVYGNIAVVFKTI